MKNVGVLFSGGVDSTYLIWKNLKEGNRVHPYYIEIKNNENKTKLEKNRIELLFTEFKKEYPDLITNIKYGMDIYITESNGLSYVQMPIWLLGVLFFSDRNIDEFQIGYVCGDDMVSYVDDILKIYNSYKSVKNYDVKLKFPILKMHKDIIYSELPPKYLSLTVTCENPTIIEGNGDIIDYTPCCHCNPCKKIMSSYLSFYGSKYKNVVDENAINSLRWDYCYLSTTFLYLLP
jgi:7-cyano-7-deazaguanine synthase in queuosine biosynthesis